MLKIKLFTLFLATGFSFFSSYSSKQNHTEQNCVDLNIPNSVQNETDQNPPVPNPHLKIPTTAHQKVILFDLGNVITELSWTGFINSAGWGIIPEAMRALAKGQNPKYAIQFRYFEVLDQFPLTPEKGFEQSRTAWGEKLPYSFVCYQAGKLTSKELLQMTDQVFKQLDDKKNNPNVNSNLAQNDNAHSSPSLESNGFSEHVNKNSFFKSDSEKSMLRGLVDSVFNPTIHVENTQLLTEGVRLLQELAAMKNPDGTKKYYIAAFTNFDREAFDLLPAKFPEVFACFDQAFVSGNLGTVKPNADIYEIVQNGLEKRGFKKENFVFIDDQKENIEACPFRAIQLINKDYYGVRMELFRLGILEEAPSKPNILDKILTKKGLLYTGIGLACITLATKYLR